MQPTFFFQIWIRILLILSLGLLPTMVAARDHGRKSNLPNQSTHDHRLSPGEMTVKKSKETDEEESSINQAIHAVVDTLGPLFTH